MDIQKKFQNQLVLVLRGGSQDVKFLSEMLQSGDVDINACNDDGITPIQMAAAYGHDEVLALLIANNSHIDESNSLGWTALMQATRNGHVSCMEKLIASGANILLQTRMGVDILSLAAASGSSEAMRCIISSVALNIAELPPLCFAVLSNETKLVNTMLNFFNPNDVLPSSGLTPLMLATMIGNKHNVTLLCSSGSDVNIRNSLGQTAVDIAIAAHDLCLKQFNCLLGKQCTSAKVCVLQKINIYKSLIEIMKKADPNSNYTIIKQENNITNSDTNKYFNESYSESCATAASLEQKMCTSAVITDSGTSVYNENLFVDEFRVCPNSPTYSYVQEVTDSQQDSNYSLSALLASESKHEQLETTPEQNVLKGLLECRNSPVMGLLIKGESCYSTPTRKFSPVMDRGIQSPLSNSAQGTPTLNRRTYLGLCNTVKIASPVLKLSPRLLASPGNSSSFRSPSKHIPHKSSGNRSPLANISRRIF